MSYKLKEGFPGQPEDMVAAVDPAFKMANEEHDENVKAAEEAMKANEEAVELVSGDNTKEKEGKVTSDTLKKMHLSESLFEDIDFSYDEFEEEPTEEDLIDHIVDIMHDGGMTEREQAINIIDLLNGWHEHIYESLIKYPNGEKASNLDIHDALNYYYGTDRDMDNNKYTDKEKQKALNYWIKKTDSPNTLKEGTKRPFDVESLAKKLDDFMYDFDTYDYNDAYESREEGYQNAITGLIDNPKYIIDMLEEILAENADNEYIENDANILLDEINQYIKSEGITESLQNDDEQLNENIFDDIAEKLVGNIDLGEALSGNRRNVYEALEDDDIYDIAEKIISECPVYINDIYTIRKGNAFDVVEFLINGDWKHDHLAFNYWMKKNASELTGREVKYGGEEIIEDTGEDFYPATHKFFFMKDMKKPVEERPEEEPEEIESPAEEEQEEIQESLKFDIAKEQIKRFNEGKMLPDWDPEQYLNNLVEKKHITEEESCLLKETFLK